MERVNAAFRNLTSNQIVIIMLIATVVFPVASFGFMTFDESGGWVVDDIAVIAILWMHLPAHWSSGVEAFRAFGGGFHILEPASIINTGWLWLFNPLFAVQVVRYCHGKSTKIPAYIFGLLSLVLPSMVGLSMMPIIRQSLAFVYVGPIPIQLVVGLILMTYAGPDRNAVLWEKEGTKSDTWWEDGDEPPPVDSE